MYVLLQKVFSLLLTVIAFFSNTAGYLNFAEAPVPEKAERFSYGKASFEKFDLYVPQGMTGEVDVLFVIHGGAWTSGDQTMFSKDCTEAVDEGYLVACVDYGKLQNGFNAVDMVGQIDAAVTKLDAVLESKGMDADKMAVIGHSAGAQLALMYSYTYYDKSAIDIAFVMANSAPSDFTDTTGDGTTTSERFNFAIASLLSGQVITRRNAPSMSDAIKTINAIDNVNACVPPTLLVHGAKDSFVPYSNSVRLSEKLKSCGVACTMVTYPEADHFLQGDEESDRLRAEAFYTFVSRYF